MVNGFNVTSNEFCRARLSSISLIDEMGSPDSSDKVGSRPRVVARVQLY